MNENTITQGSGNVFADIGIENPSAVLLRANMISYIQVLIKKHKLTREGLNVGVVVWDLLNSHRAKDHNDFSLERLMLILDQLGYRVDTAICKKTTK